MTFHFTCVGMTKSHYSSWTAKIGLMWFCESCRLNYDPVVYEREKVIMKALREVLIRVDSMDTRLGNYGENLRRLNKTLYAKQLHSKPSDSLDHTTFLQTIDAMNLDDTLDDTINRSRSGDDTSFFQVLDEINSSIANIPDKFVVGSNKRVQIITGRPEISGNSTIRTGTDVTTSAVLKQHAFNDDGEAGSSRDATRVEVNSAVRSTSAGNNSEPIVNRETNRVTLKVASGSRAANDTESFYVTPFDPDQGEDDVKKHVMDISNLHSSLVEVIKLVPRGKHVEDLSFVSFKVTVGKSASQVVGDPFYWPTGISVRLFEPNQKNGSAVRLPNTQ